MPGCSVLSMFGSKAPIGSKHVTAVKPPHYTTSTWAPGHMTSPFLINFPMLNLLLFFFTILLFIQNSNILTHVAMAEQSDTRQWLYSMWLDSFQAKSVSLFKPCETLLRRISARRLVNRF